MIKLRSVVFPAAAIVAIILCAYSWAPRNGTVWDDDAYLTQKHLSTFEGLKRIWREPTSTSHPYYPLTRTTFWIENRIWGLNPFVHHLTNILLHVLNSLLLWFILRNLKVKGAWIISVIFGVHPVCVESAGWIAERKNVLGVFFYLGSLLTFLKFRPFLEGDTSSLGDKKLYYLSLFLFLCSLLSKTAFCTLPVGLILILWWKTRKIRALDVRLLIPYFLLALILGSLTIFLEKHHTGAQGAEFEISLLERFLIAGRALWFYAGKIFFPYEVNFMYPRWRIDSANWVHYMYPLAALIVIGAFWLLRNRIGRGPITGILFFIVTLLPAIGFINHYLMRYTFVADHLQYLPMVGILAIVVSAAHQLFLAKLPRSAPYVIWGTVVLILASLTWQQTRVYKDNLTLYNDILKKNPECWMALTNRGLIFLDLGQPEQAISDLNRAIELFPGSEEAFVSRGHFYFQSGRYEEAFADFDQALKINPLFDEGYRNRGAIFFVQKKYALALADFNRALYLNPEFSRAYNARAAVYSVLRRFDLALTDYNQAIALDPEYGAAYMNRSRMFGELRRYEPALQDAMKAQSLGVPGAAPYIQQLRARIQ